MSLRSTLRKAAGLLVELPPEEQTTAPPATAAELDQLLAELESDSPPPPGSQAGSTKTVEQIVRDSAGPNLDEIQVTAPALAPVVSPEGRADFSPIYHQSGLPSSPFTAEQMLEMLASLPPELPLDTRRQTVKVTLNAMGKTIGATPETIVTDASRKLAALAAYEERLSRETTEFVSAAELEIASLQVQIEEKRAAIQAAQQKLAQTSQLCDAESDRLDDVLEFFSLDLPPSKYAPPTGETT